MNGGNTAKNSVSKRLGLLNRYFKITRFYSFLKHTAFKGGYLIAFFIAIVFLLDTFVVDINLLLSNLVDSFSPLVIFTIFLISESILGLLPPDVFIAWASKSSFPYLFLFTLASISY